MTLQEAGIDAATDKATHHHYLELYELIFTRFKGIPDIRILEIGTQFGNSLLTWRKFFGKDAVIFGVDTVEHMMDWMRGDDKLIHLLGNAYDDTMVQRLAIDRFHIIIDDGSHYPQDQKWFVANYCKLLRPDGILIVEDVLYGHTIPDMISVLPEDFQHTAVDICEGASSIDSRLFIAWKRPETSATP